MFHHANPRALLTPAMRGVLDRIARAGNPPMPSMTPEQARAFYGIGASVLDIQPHHLERVEEHHIPLRDGARIAARLYAPSRERLPLLVYFHGGGFVIGSIGTHDALCRTLAQRAHCAVLSVDYRLAPEHRFPTAVHDAWDALCWAARQDLGCDGARLAVGGDSAGGTLAAVCAILARDAGLPLALQLLFYPGVAAHQEAPSHHRYAQGFVLERETIRWFFAHYLPAAACATDWRFAPLLAPDLDGVAPVWLGLAECDPLYDDGIAYADRLRAARAPVELAVYHGVTHDFIKMGRAIPEALAAHGDATRALRHAFDTFSTSR